jgi:hypothetical protein
MTNPFTSNRLTPTWEQATEILKGDSLGHPFRGNQYADAVSASGKAVERAETNHDMAAASHVDVARHNGRPELEMHQIIAKNHGDIANLHRSTAQSLREMARNADSETTSRNLNEAAKTHEAAAHAHERAGITHSEIANGNSAEDSSATRSALHSTGSALLKSESAEAFTKMARG